MPDSAMPQRKRKRQKRGKEGAKAAHVPETAIRRWDSSSSIRRPNLGGGERAKEHGAQGLHALALHRVTEKGLVKSSV